MEFMRLWQKRARPKHLLDIEKCQARRTAFACAAVGGWRTAARVSPHFLLRALLRAFLLGCHPSVGAERGHEARIRVDPGQLVTIGRDKYICVRPPQYRYGSRTIRVEGIRRGDGGSYRHDDAVDEECDKVFPRAVSIENMISGGRF